MSKLFWNPTGSRFTFSHPARTGQRSKAHPKYSIWMVVNTLKLCSIERKPKTDDPLDILWLLMQQSKPGVYKLAEKCYFNLGYRSCDACLDTIKQPRFSAQTKSNIRMPLTHTKRETTPSARSKSPIPCRIWGFFQHLLPEAGYLCNAIYWSSHGTQTQRTVGQHN